VFSALHTNSSGNPPSTSVGPRPEILPLADGDPLSVHMWVLSPGLWAELLAEQGLVVDQIDVLTAHERDTPLSCTLIQAHCRLAPSSVEQ
jgi:hypothetical protein